MTTTPSDGRPPVWRRLLFPAVVAVIAIGAAVATLAYLRPGSSDAIASIGGPFTLTTQTGAKLSDTDLKGKPFGVFFGFTHCPEVCPTTLTEMTQSLKELGPEADNLKLLFISVDPTRDTPEFLSLYLQSFDPRIVGLTGTEAEIAAVGKEYRAFWEKVPLADGDYTMNHTATIFLMDAKGRFTGTIAYGEDVKTRVAKLKRLVVGSA
ncbi:SCO family protein [Mesorhizobium sp. BR1-1-16]|uniref:SCO family protein n=1 Tax=Mesorhizobium sp. BR1-1-16 TaxID=2876653 RepID=UPI001CCF60B1|nr:SCO family protein [Mesorhizobium sp. BR1-1-16]MBZ9937209.1 SCO family protein [Mesorhizobium sp. BR1-1-16]